MQKKLPNFHFNYLVFSFFSMIAVLVELSEPECQYQRNYVLIKKVLSGFLSFLNSFLFYNYFLRHHSEARDKC